MKNIYILATDKPSRLVKIYNDVNREAFTLKLDVEVNDSFKEYVNVYVTSDEEINSNCWVLNVLTGTIYKTFNGRNFQKDAEKEKWRKIILTTDPELIKDGVQEIDDEFLEWFCSKNGQVDFVKIVSIEDEKN